MQLPSLSTMNIVEPSEVYATPVWSGRPHWGSYHSCLIAFYDTALRPEDHGRDGDLVNFNRGSLALENHVPEIFAMCRHSLRVTEMVLVTMRHAVYDPVYDDRKTRGLLIRWRASDLSPMTVSSEVGRYLHSKKATKHIVKVMNAVCRIDGFQLDPPIKYSPNYHLPTPRSFDKSFLSFWIETKFYNFLCTPTPDLQDSKHEFTEEAMSEHQEEHYRLVSSMRAPGDWTWADFKRYGCPIEFLHPAFSRFRKAYIITEQWSDGHASFKKKVRATELINKFTQPQNGMTMTKACRFIKRESWDTGRLD